MVGNDSEAWTDGSVRAEGGFVLPPSWCGLQQQVAYLAQFGGGIQVIVGVHGAGKTTFSRWLSEDQQALPLIVMAIPAGGAQPIFYDLLQKLGLRPAPAATLGELLVMLRSYVQSLHREGQRVVVLIDNAHLIPDSELAALMSVIQGGGESGLGLHLILMAEPGLVERIDQLELIDVIVHDWSMPPFSPTEVTALIDSLSLPKTEKQGSPEYSQAIWTQSRGLPGKVVSLVQESVEPARADATPLGAKATSDALGRWPIAHLAALLVLVGVLLWAFLGRSDKSEPVITAVDVRHLLDEESRRPPASQQLPRADSAPAAIEASKEDADEYPEAQNLTTDTPPVTQEMTDKSAPGSAVTANDSLEVLSGGTEHDGVNLDSSLNGEENGARDLDVSQSAASRAAEVESSPPPKAVAQKTNAAPVEPQLQSVDSSIASAEAQLLRAPGNAYVLQIMASSAVTTLLEFVELQPNRDNLLIYRAERDGKLLHILVEGLYADKSAARAAIVNLPSDQRKGGPWPKKIDQIHQDIRSVRRR